MSRFSLAWQWRSREPAKCAPDEDFPFGKASDITLGAPGCEIEFPYPAPGVGTWIAHCGKCGYSLAVTAAGRADDPTKVRVPCKTKESA